MVDFLIAHQSKIMLVLSGICGMIALFAFITKYPSKRRKNAQVVMALSAMLLLITEIVGERFYGDPSTAGYWMSRICNFCVFIAILLVLHAFALYLADMFRIDLKLPVPRRLMVVAYLAAAGEFLVILSQFTGLYYTFDEMNRYQRTALYPISYVFPLMAIVLLSSVILRYRKKMRTQMWITLLLFSLVPLIASAFQLFIYGIYVTDMAVVGMVVVLYVFTLIDTNQKLERAQKQEIEARKREVQLLKAEQENMQKLFSETAVALVDAIDAKDAYTHGHSSRVAEYSRKIAEISGKSEKECNEIYYAALLHDVGKIGVPDSIINKNGKLTADEYGVIKSHPAIGSQILSEISDYSYLSTAARYHHERYDGTGYPDGLKGEEIPDMARIISVADAYDAMTSYRSYRAQMPQAKVREELIRCSGTQFDPEYTRIMLQLIDQDPNYTMREHCIE